MITSDEFYFPTQNLENTWSIISSCTVAPVISPNAESASSKSTYRRSKGIPTPFKARSTDSLAFTRESLCLVFDTYTSPLFIVPRANFSAIRSSSFSIPAGVLSFGVEVSTISSVSKPNLFFSYYRSYFRTFIGLIKYNNSGFAFQCFCYLFVFRFKF